MPQVQILRRDRVEVVNGEGRPIDATQITYSTQTLPPSTVVIAKLEPSDEDVRVAIQADIASRATPPGQTLDV